MLSIGVHVAGMERQCTHTKLVGKSLRFTLWLLITF
jgi:hypothetical protein